MFRANRTYLKIKTVEQLGNECEGREEDLQGINVCSMSLTQLNSSLQQKKSQKWTINMSSVQPDKTFWQSLNAIW